MEARSVMLGIAIMLLGFIGFQYSGFIAGELKGKVSRSITIALMITCVVVMLLYTVYLQLFTTVFGTDLIFALSYLFYTAGTSPITPLGQTLIAVAKPELAGIMAASAFGSFLIGFAYAIVAIATASRTAFAWATDRLIPTSLATVNARTKSPLRLIFIFFAIWYISFLGSIYGVTFITGAMTSILLSIFIWILPGVNAVLLPYRRPDLYELLPKSMRKTYGLPLVTILGIIWLLFSVPVYFVYAFWPIISEGFGKHMMGFFDYALSTGIMLTIGIVVVGVAIYYASKWYNKRQGIDMDMVFKSVPPE
jgi:APA family basic amino acid/polyamine antiporter